jgi:hypothetical protein
MPLITPCDHENEERSLEAHLSIDRTPARPLVPPAWYPRLRVSSLRRSLARSATAPARTPFLVRRPDSRESLPRPCGTGGSPSTHLSQRRERPDWRADSRRGLAAWRAFRISGCGTTDSVPVPSLPKVSAASAGRTYPVRGDFGGTREASLFGRAETTNAAPGGSGARWLSGPRSSQLERGRRAPRFGTTQGRSLDRDLAICIDPHAVDRDGPAPEAKAGIDLRRRHHGALSAARTQRPLVLAEPGEHVEVCCRC